MIERPIQSANDPRQLLDRQWAAFAELAAMLAEAAPDLAQLPPAAGDGAATVEPETNEPRFPMHQRGE